MGKARRKNGSRYPMLAKPMGVDERALCDAVVDMLMDRNRERRVKPSVDIPGHTDRSDGKSAETGDGDE